jgi:hypothetical protein
MRTVTGHRPEGSRTLPSSSSSSTRTRLDDNDPNTLADPRGTADTRAACRVVPSRPPAHPGGAVPWAWTRWVTERPTRVVTPRARAQLRTNDRTTARPRTRLPTSTPLALANTRRVSPRSGDRVDRPARTYRAPPQSGNGHEGATPVLHHARGIEPHTSVTAASPVVAATQHPRCTRVLPHFACVHHLTA